MLDPNGRKEVMAVLKKLNREEKITIVHITHNMDEACAADRVIVVDDGRVVVDGTPREVFSDVSRIKKLGLDVPQVTELLYELEKEGFVKSACWLKRLIYFQSSENRERRTDDGD